jgi:type III pantothenate kinase
MTKHKGEAAVALLVDIGNTRVKWARLVRGRLTRQRAAAHVGWRLSDFARRVIGAPRGLTRIVAVSVASARTNELFAAAARQRAGIKPEFFASARRAGGVITLYGEPWRLGADRLVAAIGAHRLAGRRAVCVVVVGTALTLDLIDSRGRHRGGAIVPAPALMKDSLLTQTNGIRRRARGGTLQGGFFARSTRAAIEQGSRYAAAAVIDRAVAEARRVLGRVPLVLLTGGGAPALRPLIRSTHTLVPDLVLRGLAVLASTSRNGP